MSNMARPPVSSVVWISLTFALIISGGLAGYLYYLARHYYRDLQKTRLDPLGLSVYPTGAGDTPATSKRPVIVFFGDSRAQQWPFPSMVSQLEFVNRGIHSQTTAQVLGRMRPHVLSLKPAIVLVQVGANDMKTIPLFPEQKDMIVANCKAHIQEIVTLAVTNGARVILTTIFPLGKLPPERRLVWSDEVAHSIQEVNQFIFSLQSDQVQVFDAAEVLRNDQGIVDPRFSKDFLHLNATGYEALNQKLAPFLLREQPTHGFQSP